MGNFKMVCLDIDGTLLNSRHEISDKTKQVIQNVANQKYIPVILVSARMPKGMLSLQKELNIVQPIICYSGALIWNHGDLQLNITIPVSDVKKVYTIVKNLSIHISLYKDDEWYIEEMDEWAKQESEITSITPAISDFSNLFTIWEQESTGPNKILCMAESHKIHQLDVKINDYLSSYLNIYPSKPTYLEIMPKHTTKTSAIEFLCKEFDILKNEIIAIGDNYNDMNMIEFAGLGIAMGNAPEQVKQIANDITLSNDEDGVAEALKKYILS
ncbi:Cof subfamily protein (haloacid dehalogenase superfamily) [Neobacillus sp. B4I6]|uniref:Cof-type HAD-IIB family hydrolase n=1 Tax=Neobacillus sp. B4I6 TaxID=3373925 RepID=UPI003D1C195D